MKLEGKSASPAKTDTVKAEPAKTEVSKVEKIDPAKPLSLKAQVDRTKTNQGKTDQAKIAQANIDQPKTDQLKIDPARSDQAKSDQIRTGSDTTPKPLVEVASARGSSRSAPLARVAPLNSSPISAAPVGAVPATFDSIGGDKPAATTLSSLPPEPVGVEPPASFPALDDLKRDDSKRDGLKNDVKEVVPAKRGTLGDRSLTRALGLKLGRIVIDPGHGGNDVGTHGPSGYYEKDLTLDVARRLAEIVRENMGSDVVLTRSDDEYVGLEERTRVANEKKADLFVSIHANSSPYRSAAGVETYVLSFTTSRTAMDLASRENASADLGIHDLRDLLQKIALRDKVDESQELAARLQTSLSTLSTSSNKGAINRGVKKAPFVVLIGANMPSVLAEIGFLTNSTDEALLRKPEHRQKIAEALYKGIASYADSLSQVIARKN